MVRNSKKRCTCVMASNQIPEPLQCKTVFNRYLSSGRSNPKISKNEVHFFRILVLGGLSPPSQLVPNHSNSNFVQVRQLIFWQINLISEPSTPCSHKGESQFPPLSGQTDQYLAKSPSCGRQRCGKKTFANWRKQWWGGVCARHFLHNIG